MQHRRRRLHRPGCPGYLWTITIMNLFGAATSAIPNWFKSARCPRDRNISTSRINKLNTSTVSRRDNMLSQPLSARCSEKRWPLQQISACQSKSSVTDVVPIVTAAGSVAAAVSAKPSAVVLAVAVTPVVAVNRLMAVALAAADSSANHRSAYC